MSFLFLLKFPRYLKEEGKKRGGGMKGEKNRVDTSSVVVPETPMDKSKVPVCTYSTYHEEEYRTTLLPTPI